MDQKIKDILDEVGKVIRGKDEQIQMVLTAILAKGHILIEDIPGVGKTTMAVCFSRAMELTERRLQFTPDVLPSDVVGFNMLDAGIGKICYGFINGNAFIFACVCVDGYERYS